MKDMNDIFKPLKHPPIVETVFAVNLNMPEVKKEELTSMVKGIDSDINLFRELRHTNVSIDGSDDTVSKESFWSGSQFKKGDNLIITIQNSHDPGRTGVDFSVSMMPPYTSWKDFTDKAFIFFQEFVKKVRPRAVNRLAVRTIDRIVADVVPCPIESLVHIGQLAMKGLSAPMVHELFYRDSVLFPEEEVYATIIKTAPPVLQNQKPFVILDVDAFIPSQMDPDEEKIRSSLERIHKVRNLVFFNLISDKVLEKLS